MTNESCDKPAAMAFEVLKAAIIDGSAARLGRLALAGRRAIDTPNYFAVTSRGVVPHMTPDNVGKYLHTGGAYMALEDCRLSQCSPGSDANAMRQSLNDRNSMRRGNLPSTALPQHRSAQGHCTTSQLCRRPS